jgi:hypothetical protein
MQCSSFFAENDSTGAPQKGHSIVGRVFLILGNYHLTRIIATMLLGYAKDYKRKRL